MRDTANCYAWSNADGWEAICVDFDLAAQGDSFEEVRSELFDAIGTLLLYAEELPESERNRLLNRKAPLSLRLKLEVLHRLSQLPVFRGTGRAHRYAFHTEQARNPVQ